jgi:polyisoprenoid-binding protein YceI
MSTTTEIRRTLMGTWGLDPVHSSVGFEVPYLTGTFKGQFRDVEAQIAVDDSEASLEGAAKVDSVDVKDENLAAHLHSPDFFDAQRHPELRFTANDIDLDSETVRVRGELTIKGITKPVEATGTWTAPAADAFGNSRGHLNLEAVIDRTEWDMNWNMPLPSGGNVLNNDVTLTVEISLVEQQA